MRLTASKKRQHGLGHVVQCAAAPNAPANAAPRVGYTVSKKVHKRAVVRNLVRRRLREIVRREAAHLLRDGHDYVLVARRDAIDMPFAQLTQAVVSSLQKLNPKPRVSHDH